MNVGRSIDFESHLIDQRVEDYEFLTSKGLDKDAVARRLGISRNVLDKTLERRRTREQRHPVQQEAAGQGPGG
jgi:predicted DNA-binding protein (UPF0251 family)